MLESNPLPIRSRVPNTWRSLLVLVGFILVGMSIGNMVALLVLMKFLSGQDGQLSVDVLTELIQSPADVPNGWYGLMILQATAHVCTYLLPPLLYWTYIERKTIAQFQIRPLNQPVVWGLVLLVVLAFMPFNSLIIEWNANMHLPGFMQGVEQWMRDKEDQMAGLTDFLTDFDSPGQFILAMLVIAVIPAVGEELLFRGVIQRKFAEAWANVHVAIWVSAAVFSAIHFQFYGFFPRMLLGALFGYIYYWTGSLTLTIFAHFVNNGFMVLMIFLYHQKAVDIDIEDSAAMPWGTVVVSAFVTAAILYGLWKERNKAVVQL